MLHSIFDSKHYCYLLLALLLLPITASAKAEVEQQFKQALIAIKEQQFEQAEAILANLLEQQPELHRARAELALLQVQKQSWQQAAANLSLLLAVTDLPTKVRSNLQKLNDRVQQQLSSKPVQAETLAAHHFNGAVQVSLGYDSDFSLGNVSELLLDDDSFLETEYIATESVSLTDLCGLGNDNCALLVNLVDDSQVEVSRFTEQGVITEQGLFIPYAQLLLQANYINDSGDFWRNQFNLRHQYTAANNTYQWRNEASFVVDTPLDDELSYKRQVRLESSLNWRIDKQWLASGQIYYKDFARDQDESFEYWGFQPELAYISDYGKFSLRADWFKKTFINNTISQQESFYQGLAVSWADRFINNDLVLNINLRYADSEANRDVYDFSSKGASVSALYHVNQSWQIYGAANHTYFNFAVRPSVTVAKYIVRTNYAIANNWYAFASYEFNRISQLYDNQNKYRSIFHLGVKWQF